MGPRPHLWFSACTTACLASELLVSMDSSPPLWFLHAKQRLLDPNSKSLLVPDITCSFVPPMQCDYHQNYMSLWVLALLCGFCIQNSTFWSRITSLYWSQPSSVVFACKTATFSLEYKSLWVPDLTFRFVYAKQRDLHKNKKTISVPALTCGFVHSKQQL